MILDFSLLIISIEKSQNQLLYLLYSWWLIHKSKMKVSWFLSMISWIMVGYQIYSLKKMLMLWLEDSEMKQKEMVSLIPQKQCKDISSKKWNKIWNSFFVSHLLEIISVLNLVNSQVLFHLLPSINSIPGLMMLWLMSLPIKSRILNSQMKPLHLKLLLIWLILIHLLMLLILDSSKLQEETIILLLNLS